MFTLTVDLNVLPGHLEDFIVAIKKNAEASFNNEPGCVYFDVNQSIDDDHHFTFFEVYEDKEALEAHRQAAHFFEWREAVAEHVVPGSQDNVVATRLFHHQ